MSSIPSDEEVVTQSLNNLPTYTQLEWLGRVGVRGGDWLSNSYHMLFMTNPSFVTL